MRHVAFNCDGMGGDGDGFMGVAKYSRKEFKGERKCQCDRHYPLLAGSVLWPTC